MNRYPAYKDSGVKWLGEIPVHWQLLILRRVVRDFIDYRGQTPEKVEQGIPLITARNVKDGFLDFQDSQEFIATEMYRAWMVRGLPEAGDVIVTTEAPLGNVAQINDNHVALAQRLILLKANSDLITNDYLKYYFLSLSGKGELQSQATGSTAEGIKASKLKSILLCVPPLSEQRAIAHYLDRQTSKIDTLITAKQHLLELLTEKRRALITHAVIRGLNPDAPKRDSGIEWLGEIPSHWNIERLRWFVKTLEQGWSPQAEEREPGQEEWGVLKLNAVKDGQFDPSKAKALPASIEIPVSLEIRSGDFLITRANTPELVGDICYVHETRSQLILSDLIYRLRLDESKLDGKFLSYFLQAPSGRLQIEADARGSSASMVKISQGHILDWLLILPPLSEQQAIVAYIESEISKLANLKEGTEHTIELLQERRVALISAAVTGQIHIPA